MRDGHDVLVIDDLSGGFRENVPSGAQFQCSSVLDPLDSTFERFRPDVVYHLAAYAAEGLSHHIPVFNFTNNVTGTANVLATAQRVGVRHFVFTSSIAVYGHPAGDDRFTEATPPKPVDPYGIAKLACEQHISAAEQYFQRPSYTIFRPHNVFGPRQNIADPYRNVVGIFMAAAMDDRPMPVFGDGTQTRSFSYIDVVAEAIARSPEISGARNLIVNIGGDEPMSVRDLARATANLMGVRERLDFLPPRREVQHAHCDHSLARSIFTDIYARHAVDIMEGLRRMAAFVRSQAPARATDCPSPIEITDRLPQSWAARLSR